MLPNHSPLSRTEHSTLKIDRRLKIKGRIATLKGPKGRQTDRRGDADGRRRENRRLQQRANSFGRHVKCRASASASRSEQPPELRILPTPSTQRQKNSQCSVLKCSDIYRDDDKCKSTNLQTLQTYNFTTKFTNL